jgi:hypothetical protein
MKGETRMSVKMSYATLDSGVLKHISQTKSGRSYYCPTCKGAVFPRKGNKNAHSFAHASSKDCTYTPETALHFEAKHYLVEAIKKNIEAPLLSFPFSLLSDLIKELSSLLRVEPKHTVSLLDICSFYTNLPYAETEKRLGPYLIDVLLKDKRYAERNLAIEVLVTHESENAKIEYFKTNLIPFLELTPHMDDEGHFSFNVHDYYLPEFFSSIEADYEKKLASLIYQKTKPLLLEELQLEVSAVEETRMKIKAVQALKQHTSNMRLAESFGTKENSGYAYFETRSLSVKEDQLVEVQTIDKRFSKNNELSVLINGQYWVNNAAGQYYDLVSMLLKDFAVDVRVGRYKNSKYITAQGVGIHVPSAEVWENETRLKMKSILDNFEKKFENKLKNQLKLLDE